jgi:HD-like signal output (HDOD) protein
MINILFVDDEPNILEGLQRMLRPLRHEWSMHFANSGAEALNKFEELPMDVIVSDMKMPGMDGAQLLSAVMEKYPHVIRIILSGYSEKEMIIKSVGTAHQYLSKPCDSDTLQMTVKRVSALRNLLTNETLRGLVSQLPNVPSLPTLYTELIDELGKAEPSTRAVGEIVKKDIGMTVKLLQMVNSAFFGLRRRVSDSTEAVEFLGLDTISSLTLGLGIISQMESRAAGAILAELWSHSMAVAVMANKIAICEDRSTANDAFTAGLLHDLGKVVLATNLPAKFKMVDELVKQENISGTEAEKRIFQATHAEVGAFLIGLWGLPAHIVGAVEFHNTPNESGIESFTALTAVHAANAFQHWAGEPGSGDEIPGLDMGYIASLGLTDRIPIWHEKCAAFHADVVSS